MKKTVNINLNSFIFNIDEDAYNKLKAYLEKLESHFLKYNEGEEIIRDIEGRIAEIFNMKINNQKQVINISDVDEVISILGNAEDIVGDSEPDISKEENNKSKSRKKLYRDPDNKILGGVCAGLAAYTGIDVILWRILFIVLALVWTLGIVIYLILWIIMPEAKTIAQKVEMKGEKIDLSNIEKNVKEEYENIKKNVNTKKINDGVKSVANGLASVLTTLLKIFGKIIGLCAIIFGALLIAALIIMFFGGTNFLPFPALNTKLLWLPELLASYTNPAIAWVITICIALLVIIPVIAIISMGVSLLFKVKSNKFFNIGTFILWFICLITVIISITIGANSFKYKEKRIVNETVNIAPDIPYYYFSKTNNTDYNFIAEDSDISIKNKYFLNLDEEKIIELPRITFKTTTDTVIRIKFNYESRGSDPYKAEQNTFNFSYEYNLTDTAAYFDPYYIVNTEEWFFHNLKISVYIPIGTKFKIDESLDQITYFDEYIKYRHNIYESVISATGNGFFVLDN